MDSSALPVVLVPAALVLVVRALLALVRAPAGARDAGTTLAVLVAVPASLGWVGLRARFPVAGYEDGWRWLIWIVPAGALVGFVEARVLRRLLGRILAQTGGSLGACMLLVAPLGSGFVGAPGLRDWRWLWALPIVTLWGTSAWPEGAVRRRSISASALTTVLVAVPILFRGAHSVSLAAIGAAVGSALIGACGSFRHGLVPFPRALCGVLAAGFGGLLVAARAYQGDLFPTVSALPLFAAAAAGIAVPVRLGRVRAPVVAAGAALALAAVSAWTSGTFERYDAWW